MHVDRSAGRSNDPHNVCMNDRRVMIAGWKNAFYDSRYLNVHA